MFFQKYKKEMQYLINQICELKTSNNEKDTQIQSYSSEVISKDNIRLSLMTEISVLKNRISTQDIKLKSINVDKEAVGLIELKGSISEYKRVLADLDFETNNKIDNLKSLTAECIEKQSLIQVYTDGLFLQDLCIYSPKFKYDAPQMYKDKIRELRLQQKVEIKSKGICYSKQNFVINGSDKDGQFISKSLCGIGSTIISLQCDNIINRVNHINVNKSLEDIDTLFFKLNRIFELVQIVFNCEYKELKKDELRATYEYELKRQEERERLAEEREILREQDLLEKEVENNKIKLEKEKMLLQLELERINIQDNNYIGLNDKIKDIEEQIETGNHRLANQKCGWVYCISNDSLRDMVKIGISRRLVCDDRISELGSGAGLPFKFKTHFVAFSEDCFKDEKELHQKFADKKVNLFNLRKEHFYIAVEEAELAFKEKFGDGVKFNKEVINEDYMYSENIRNQIEEMEL